MKTGRALALFLKSRLHITLAAVLGGLLLLTLVFAPQTMGMVAPFAVVLYEVGGGMLFLSHRGARAVVDEAEEERQKKVLACIDHGRELHDRISFQRIGDDGVRQAVEYFLPVSGE